MGPNGDRRAVTADDVRNEVRRYADSFMGSQDGKRFGFQDKSGESTYGLGERIYSGYEDQAYVNTLVDLYNNNALSDRSKREFALEYLQDSTYVANSQARLRNTVKNAEGQIVAGEGSEYARVLREKYVANAAQSPGRRQTIMTGRF